MSVGLGNHLLFGALRGLRVVERPRSGGPLRRVDGPRPAAEPLTAPAAAPTERVSLSPEALRLSRQTASLAPGPDPAAPAAEGVDGLTRLALRAYAEHARS